MTKETLERAKPLEKQIQEIRAYISDMKMAADKFSLHRIDSFQLKGEGFNCYPKDRCPSHLKKGFEDDMRAFLEKMVMRASVTLKRLEKEFETL